MSDRRFPEPADAREFVALLTRLGDAECRLMALCDRYAGGDWEDLLAPDDRDNRPPPGEAELEAAEAAVVALRRELLKRLEGLDFAAPFGWTDEFISAVAVERKSLRDQGPLNVFRYLTTQGEGDKPRLVFEPPLAFFEELFRRAMRAEAIAQDVNRERLRELRAEIERRRRRNAPGSIREAVVAPEPAEAPAEPWKGEAASSVLDGESIPIRAIAATEPAEAPATFSPVDFAKVASELRKARKPTQARLVEFMSNKTEAEVQDVGKPVHDDDCAGDKAVRANINRTNESLQGMRVPLRFRLVSGRVFRDVLPA